MQKNTFNIQLERLKSQWPNAYGHERVARIWQVWKNVSDEIFTEIVDEAIDTCRSAPLTSDLAELEQQIKKRKALDRSSFELSKISFNDLLNNASRKEGYADAEFVKLCMKVVLSKDSLEKKVRIYDDLEKLSKSY